jgi:hypothetical protein
MFQKDIGSPAADAPETELRVGDYDIAEGGPGGRSQKNALAP